MKKINNLVSFMLVTLMILMTITVLWGVLTRYAFGNQASWSEELARFLLIWIGLLGTAYASGKKKHLAINLLHEKLNKKKEQSLQQFIAFLIFLFAFGVMVIGGGRLIYIVSKLGQHSPALNIPMQFVYMVIPLSGILIMLYKIEEFFNLSKS